MPLIQSADTPMLFSLVLDLLIQYYFNGKRSYSLFKDIKLFKYCELVNLLRIYT